MGTIWAGEAAGSGAVATGRGGRGRGTRGGVIVRPAEGRGAPPGPKPYATAGGSAPAVAAVLRRARAEMQPKASKEVGGAGAPCSEEADAERSLIAAEPAPCEVVDGEGA